MPLAIDKKVVAALAILAVILSTGVPDAFCRNHTAPPCCCEGKCSQQSMPAQHHQSSNCCTVSNADRSQPALVNGLGQSTEYLKQIGQAQIESSIAWCPALDQPSFPRPETYRQRVKPTPDLPTLCCSLLI
jgi:hypothetical protein